MLSALPLLAGLLAPADAQVIRQEAPVIFPRDDAPANPDSLTVWDYAPDYSKDAIKPYPPLGNADGSNITIENLRGTRLFGWKGCGDRWKQVRDSWHEFHDLIKDEAVYKNIDWRGKPARDFWGGSSKENELQISQKLRDDIQNIYSNSESMWSYWWSRGAPPWQSWRYLWIEVKCSGEDNSGDPQNLCGEGTNETAIAYATPSGTRYSQITFCSPFFKLPSLKEVTETMLKKSDFEQNDLNRWDNKAVTMLHEVTHLSYFMNTGNAYGNNIIEDFEFKFEGEWYGGYGVWGSKMLRAFDVFPAAFSSRNADNFAYYAMALYAMKARGGNKYPWQPATGKKRPSEPPRQSRGEKKTVVELPPQDQWKFSVDSDPELKDQPETDMAKAATVKGRKPDLGEPSKDGTAPGPASPQCPDNQPSGVSRKLFNPIGGGTKLYAEFCKAAADQTKELSWDVDNKGSKLSKRSPPLDADAYKDFKFSFSYKPAGGNCKKSCEAAYDAITASRCGHQAAEQFIMAMEGSMDAGCGTYSYKIQRPTTPDKPAGPAKTEFKLFDRTCNDKDAFGGHKDVQPRLVQKYAEKACKSDKKIKKGQSDSHVSEIFKRNHISYTFKAYWKDGCETDVDEVSLSSPLNNKEAKDESCYNMFHDDFASCNNGGVGGSRQAGCVVYEFNIGGK